MSTLWSGRPPRPRSTEGPARVAHDAAAAALLDLDTRQTYVAAAVASAGQMLIGTDLPRRWRPIAERSFEASAAYLEASERHPAPDGNDQAAAHAYTGAHEKMTEAATAIDDFYRKHRSELESARSKAAAAPRIAADARSEAERAVAAVAAADPEYQRYPSVNDAMASLSEALVGLAASGGPADQHQRADHVRAAAEALSRAVAAAPGAARAAASAIASVRTRLDAIQTKVDRLAPAQSALLREFSAASSADLARNRPKAETALADARAAHASATELLAAGDPEGASAEVTRARARAADADTAVTQVQDRLAALRTARNDPKEVERRVRFRIRDAQRLVVDTATVAEWGSVLDAQSARVDRAVAALTGPHPDYWALLTEVDAVTTFVADIVARVRAQVAGK